MGCNRSTQQRISGRVAFDRLEELKNQTRKIHSLGDQRLGVLDVEIDKDIEMDSDLIEEVKILPMSQTSTTFLKISTGSSSFAGEAQIGHAFPEEIVVSPRFPMGIRRN